MLGFILWFSLTFGLQEGYTLLPKDYYVYPPIYANIELHAENKIIDIYGRYRNEMDAPTNLYFTPRRDFYTIGVTFKYKAVALTFEHECAHAVGPYGKYVPFDQGHNKVEVTIKSKQ